MKKSIISVLALIFLTTFVTAGINLNAPIFSTYNLGDNIELPINIIGDPEINDLLTISLNCNNLKTEIYREYISLNEKEKNRDLTIPLIKGLIGESKGFCFVEYTLGTFTQNLTQQFKISNKIELKINELKSEYSPSEKAILRGTAIKENGQGANGVIEAQIIGEDFESLVFSKIVKDGNFDLEISFPENIKAGDHLLSLKVYEKDSNSIIINSGELNQQIKIIQVPTNLEILLEKNEIIPGTDLKGELILHDQTGEDISQEVYFSIKNSKGELVEKRKTTTEEGFSYYINATEKPSEWTISAMSGELQDERTIYLLENKKIQTEIINNTLIVTNIGNVFYDDEIEIQIGNETRNLIPELEVGESQEYLITAPTGEYLVSVGDESQQMTLTGNAIDIKKLTKNPFSGFSILVWIFLFAILGFVGYLIYKKGYKRTFFGKRKSKINETEKTISKKSGFIVNPKNKAEMSLSIQGNKQTGEIVLLNFKNYPQLKSGEGNIKETLESIIHISDEHKILTFHNNENIYFIFAPEVTRTFKNQSNAIKFAEKIFEIIKKHNKIFKQKIEYGIGIDSGDIVLKREPTEFKFATMGNFLTNLKKIASSSTGEILFSRGIKDKLEKNMKTDSKEINNLKVYTLKEIISQPDHSKFIKGFMERLERDKKVKEEE